MPQNPSFSSAAYDAHNSGAYKYDSQNDVTGESRQRRNTFGGLGRPVLDTFKYGEITPFECIKAVVDDTHRLYNNIHLRSYTLKSPMFSNIKMNKDYYQIPLSSILPRTWELYYRNPQKGDDVPADVYCNFDFSPTNIIEAFNGFRIALASGVISTSGISLDVFFYYIWLWSYVYHVYSSASLPVRFGIATNKMFRWSHGAGRVSSSDAFNFQADDYVDDWFDKYFNVDADGNIGAKRLTFYTRSGQERSVIKSFDMTLPEDVREFWRYIFSLADGFLLDIESLGGTQFCLDVITDSGTLNFYGGTLVEASSFEPVFAAMFGRMPHMSIPSGGFNEPLGTASVNTCTYYTEEPGGHVGSGLVWTADGNVLFPARSATGSNVDLADPADRYNLYDIAPIVAYQQACAQFHTVDAIDNLFNSDLWMKNMRTLINTANSFDYNGDFIEYDTFSLNRTSATAQNAFLSDAADYSSIVTPTMKAMAFLYNLFSYRESLVYGDYFTGGRLEPLAVGDVTVTVADEGVNVVDISKQGWKARFLNFVNRFGAQIQDYIRGLFGVTPGQLQPMPKFIAHESSVVSGFEVENTTPSGDTVDTQQGYPVTMLNSRSGQFAFDVYVDCPSWLIGVVSFTMTRFYDSVTDRQAFCKNRFDEFNPFMQNIGDQSVYAAEASPQLNRTDPEYPISYQLRDTQWKQRVPVARGAFVKSSQNLLPSWALVIDLKDFKLDSDHIRNHNHDLDVFYQSLSGKSLASYFHFIAYIDNQLESDRPMQYKPLLKL